MSNFEYDIGTSTDPTRENVKRTRGCNKSESIAISAAKGKIRWNALGQPIGIWKKKLSSAIGAMSKQLFPVTKVDWTKVSKEDKQRAWLLIQVLIK